MFLAVVAIVLLATPFVQTASLQDNQAAATATLTPTPTATPTPIVQSPLEASLATIPPVTDDGMPTLAPTTDPASSLLQPPTTDPQILPVMPTLDPLLVTPILTLDSQLITSVPTSDPNVLVPTVDPLMGTPIPTLDPMLLVPTVDPFLSTAIPTVDPLLLTPIPTVDPLLITPAPTLDPMLLVPTVDPLLVTAIPTVDPLLATPAPDAIIVTAEPTIVPPVVEPTSADITSVVSGRVDSVATDSVLVIVSDPSGQMIASTVTNADGSYAVELPADGEYVVTFDDGVSLRASQPIAVAGGTAVTTETRALVWGDLNRDMVIDELDVVTLASVYGQPADPNGALDLNGDGLVGLWELFMMAINYGESVSPSA